MIGEAAAAISSIKTLSDLVKSLKPGDPNEIKSKMGDILTRVLEAQVSVMELVSKNSDLAAEVEDLKKKLVQQDELEFRDDMFWKKKADGSPDGPFCPKCFQGQHQQVYMVTLQGITGQDIGIKCPVCDFKKEKPRTPSAPMVIGPGNRRQF